MLGTGPVTAWETVLKQGRRRRSQQGALAPSSGCGGEAYEEAPGLSPNCPRWFLCSEEGRGWSRRRPLLSAGRHSELLQAAVHLPLALLPGPGPALGAELLQVFFKVLMVHGPVAGGLAVRLGDRAGEVRVHLSLS